MHDSADPQALIARWQQASGSVRANYQLFVADLCRLLGTDPPEPAREDPRDNACVFERRVVFAHGDGSTSHGFIECYRRGHFVLEAKKIRAGAHTRGFDDALLRARARPTPARCPPPRAGLPEQIKAVAEVLAATQGALSLADLETRFRARGRWRERLPVIVDTLAALGRARAQDDGRWHAV